MLLTVQEMGPQSIAVSTCHPGATEWITVNYQHHLPYPFYTDSLNKFVFCNGLFYCLSSNDWLGVFDPLQRTWNVLAVPPPKRDGKLLKIWRSGTYMTEHRGEIILIYRCSGSAKPIMFKLDRRNMVWEEMKSLNGITVFGSFLSSHSRTVSTSPTFVSVERVACHTVSIIVDTIRVRSVTWEVFILKISGLNRPKTSQASLNCRKKSSCTSMMIDEHLETLFIKMFSRNCIGWKKIY